MNQPHFTQVDEQLRAVLVAALQRDANVLHNADHLYALLGDLAPDMPVTLRDACVAVARTDATSWYAHTPPYTEEQVVDWLRSQFPYLMPDAARAALATIATFGAGSPAPAPPAAPVSAPVPTPSPVFEPPPAPVPVPSPVFDNQTVTGPEPISQPVVQQPVVPANPPSSFDTETVAGGGFVPVAQPPVQQPPFPANQPAFAPNQASWPPPPSGTQRNKSKVPLILTLVAVLVLAGAGVGAYFLFKNSDSGSKTKLAAPQNVTALEHEGNSVMVSWESVPNADHYVVTDTTGAAPKRTVRSTLAIFDNAAGDDHQFVVQAYDEDGTAGAKSDPAMWMMAGAPAAPASLTVVRKAYNLQLAWPAVDGAEGYQVRDTDDPSFTPDVVQSTTYEIRSASLTAHHFTVSAVRGGQTGDAATATFEPRHTLSADEATLAYRLQSNEVVPGSCHSYQTTIQPRYISAGISCDPVGARLHKPTNLYVFQLKPGVQNTYEAQRFDWGLIHQDGCGVGSDYPELGVRGKWKGESSPKLLGDTYCWVTGKYSVLVWTYYKENILFEANGKSPTTRAGLYEWWSGTPAPLRQP